MSNEQIFLDLLRKARSNKDVERYVLSLVCNKCSDEYISSREVSEIHGYLMARKIVEKRFKGNGYRLTGDGEEIRMYTKPKVVPGGQ